LAACPVLLLVRARGGSLSVCEGFRDFLRVAV
jgi:hypothetical protein